jgi:putative FmdB family regulatory protein
LPRYDYQCTSCGLEFELIQSFQEAGSGVCPKCSGVGRRVYHAVPVIYKGSGFYTTDYGRPKTRVENNGKESRDDAKESKTTSEKDSAKDSSASAESKSESTSKASSEAKT